MNKLREVRRRKGYSGDELAALAQVNRNTVYLAETGQQSPHGSTRRKLAAVLGVTLDELWPETENATTDKGDGVQSINEPLDNEPIKRRRDGV